MATTTNSFGRLRLTDTTARGLRPTSTDRPKLYGHRPGLDGLRGLSVVAVLAFHGGFGWPRGGYLGVSAFFTLSGFLIATLLLREHDVTGSIDLRAFWWRRARRLLPAGLLGLLLAVGYAAVQADTIRGLRGDVMSSLAYVANWRFIFSERSYAELFADPSPVQHYWSLAVEEQFYVLFPLLVVGCAAFAHRFRAVFVTVLVSMSVASVAWTLDLAGSVDPDRMYYGTDTRAVEILLGALAAVALLRTSSHGRPPVATRWATLAGVGGLQLVAASWVFVDQGSAVLHPWVLLGHAVAVVGVINAAVRVGPVADALSFVPLRALGKMSYGIYLYHWPVFLAVSEARVELSPVPLFAVRVGITLVLATVSLAVVERPLLRRAEPQRRRRRVILAVAAIAAVVIAVVAIPPAGRTTIDFDTAAEALADTGEERPTGPEGRAGPVEGPAGLVAEEPLSIAVFGDSVALMSGLGIDAWAEQTGELRVRTGSVELGCPVARGGTFEYVGQRPVPGKCDWTATWPTALLQTTADVAVVHLGTWDIVERTIPGRAGILQIGDAALEEYLLAEIIAANDLLLTAVESVIWMTLPDPAPFAVSDSTMGARVERFNELVRLAVDASSGPVQVVDLDAWIATQGPDDRDLRPDGVHFSGKSAPVAGSWLGPAIIHAVDNPSVVVVGPDDVPTMSEP